MLLQNVNWAQSARYINRCLVNRAHTLNKWLIVLKVCITHHRLLRESRSQYARHLTDPSATGPAFQQPGMHGVGGSQGQSLRNVYGLQQPGALPPQMGSGAALAMLLCQLCSTSGECKSLCQAYTALTDRDTLHLVAPAHHKVALIAIHFMVRELAQGSAECISHSF